ncbi:NTP transferase domain-containing protein [Candidatus Gottesmanbacteria bacterium]|nr:NTP transferase domain-containing protein [Candidatus Gottesmanbacteria bacterium]
MDDLTILLLAGGDSDRFWPLGDKHSIKFLGKPFVYYHLSQFSKLGFKNIVIIVNKNNEAFFHNLKNDFTPLDINLVLQADGKGMAGAILSAKHLIQNKRIIIRNSSDIYEDILLPSIISELKENPDGILTGVSQSSYFPGGYLQISDNKIVGIIEKPSPEKIPSNIVTIAFNYFKDANLLINVLSKMQSTKDDIFEKTIDFLIKEGAEFKFLPYKGYWGYLKYPWHVLDINSYFLHKIKGQKIKKAIIHKSSILSGDVYLEDGVRILENSKIAGPTYIGSGTIIGQNCLIRESMIGANCVVGFSTEIARSYIGDNCWFHSNYLGDSIISSNVAMGAGTVLANYKLSEGSIMSFIKEDKVDTGKVKLGSMIGPNVRIGINSSIMPGIKIGKGSFVGAGVILDKDLPDDRFAYPTKSGYTLKNNNIKITQNSRSDARNKLNL